MYKNNIYLISKSLYKRNGNASQHQRQKKSSCNFRRVTINSVCETSNRNSRRPQYTMSTALNAYCKFEIRLSQNKISRNSHTSKYYTYDSFTVTNAKICTNILCYNLSEMPS